MTKTDDALQKQVFHMLDRAFYFGLFLGAVVTTAIHLIVEVIF